MPREKKTFEGYDLDNVIFQANMYLINRRGWDVIQLTYNQSEDFNTIAFTAVDKDKNYTRHFMMTKKFEEITGSKAVGVFYIGRTRYFVGVPS